jgi:integrase
MNSIPHRTDAKRGRRERVAPGVYVRAGRYIVQYTDSEGRVHFKTTSARNLTEAKAEREKLRVDVRAGNVVAPSKATVKDVADDFFAAFESLVLTGEKSERTLELYRQRWRTHLERPLGRIPVQGVRAEHVARVLESLRRSGLSPWTVKGIYTLAGAIFSHAMSRGLLAESPLKRMSKAERPSGKSKTQARTLTDAECGKLIGKAPGEWRTMVADAAGTGLRLSELLGLRWQDVDFEAGLVHVRFQLSRATGQRPAKLVPLKSGAGERDVFLVLELVSLLKRHKAEAFSRRHARPDSFVFATRDGHPLSQRNAARALTNAADKAGLNPDGVQTLSWHDLRHTSISRLIAAGLDVVQVQRQAGHARPSITLDIYSHEFERAKRSDDIRAKIAATGIGAVLGRGEA